MARARWFFVAALICAYAVPTLALADDPPPNVKWGPSYGSGEYCYRIAVINDVHIGEGIYGSEGWNDHFMPEEDPGENAQKLTNDVTWINNNYVGYRIGLVIILGDIASVAQISAWEATKAILSQLQVPYFPVIGDHDVWPHSWDNPPDNNTLVNAPNADGSLNGPDQWFDLFWGPVIDSVAAYAESAGVIRGWHRMPSRRWNWYADAHAGPEGFGLCPPRYSFFQDFSFDMGPEDQPFHFVCSDFCGREKTPLGTFPWDWFPFHLTFYGDGGSFDADDFQYWDLRGGGFVNHASSAVINGNSGGTVDIWSDENYTGEHMTLEVGQSYDTAVPPKKWTRS
jgi:hypothetical protein